MKKILLILIPLVMLAAVGGFFYGKKKAHKEMYSTYTEILAIDTVLPTQVLYAIKSGSAEDAILWLESDICGKLILIGGSDEYDPNIKNSDVIKKSLSLPRQYGEDFDLDFCQKEYGSANKALSWGDTDVGSYTYFYEKYGESN